MKGPAKMQALSLELTESNGFIVKNHKKIVHLCTKCTILSGASGRTRTYNPSVNSRMLCH